MRKEKAKEKSGVEERNNNKTKNGMNKSETEVERGGERDCV